MARIKRKETEENKEREASMPQNQISTQDTLTMLKVQPLGSLHDSNSEVSPIIFEECYAMDNDPKFVEMVKKSSTELSE